MDLRTYRLTSIRSNVLNLTIHLTRLLAIFAILLPGASEVRGADSPGQDSQGESTQDDAPPAIDLDEAAAAFAEAREVFDRDGERLWGVTLDGPLLFADPQTRTVVANQADDEGLLSQSGEVYVGKLPPNMAIANTALHWGGVHWAMVMWPLPDSELDRRALMAHESWHRVQDKLGFVSSGADNSHLDSLKGRIWLQMEWRALDAALLAEEQSKQRDAVHDAVVFRAYRRSLFETASAAEREMEMHEGIAEYTGIKLAAESDAEAIAKASNILQNRPGNLQTFVRSFAYVSGPAYGLLLDQHGDEWRKGAATKDFGEMLAEATGIFKLSQDLEAEATQRATKYHGEALILAENKREEERLEKQARFKQQFVEGSIVHIPLQKMRMSFNPNEITPFGDHGTVYGTITINDIWGKLTVEQGCLVAKDWRSAVVSSGKSPQAGMSNGPGWELALEPGWAIVADGDREGSFVLKNAEDQD